MVLVAGGGVVAGPVLTTTFTLVPLSTFLPASTPWDITFPLATLSSAFCSSTIVKPAFFSAVLA